MCTLGKKNDYVDVLRTDGVVMSCTALSPQTGVSCNGLW